MMPIYLEQNPSSLKKQEENKTKQKGSQQLQVLSFFPLFLFDLC